MEFALQKIQESADSISSQSFSRPKNSPFATAVLDKSIDITSLIRDLEPAEEGLHLRDTGYAESFTVAATTGENGGHGPELDVELACATIEKLIQLYPVKGAADKVAQFRASYAQLSDDILRYEDIVEDQRQQLAQLNIYLEERDYGTDDLLGKSGDEIRAQTEQVEKEIEQLERQLESARA